MAQSAHVATSPQDTLLGRYLRALARDPDELGRARAPGHAVRTCPTCGQRAIFALESEGTWYRCSRCGHYA
jgi:ribosomal protein L37AE/L43A